MVDMEDMVDMVDIADMVDMNNLPVAVVERCCLGPTCNQLAALAI